ncbi:MAG TPA: precorrin-3B synthase [Xanthobacteraceae bacterium]|jgi:precorrin-3B synthase|nr:precorrin-3B synthase [Xanthobacteraceae bacterium]
MTAHMNHSFPERRGVCPGLSRPLPTGDGLLVRLMPTGTIALDAFAALCAAAQRHGNGIIEITARGSIQIRGLNAGSAPKFASEIAALDIAAADGVPVLCNPLAGLDAEDIFDVAALAATLRGALAQQSFAERLDPKVSVTIDGGGPFNLAHVAADFRLSAQLVNGKPALRIGVGGDAVNAVNLGLITPEAALEAALRLISVLAQRGRSVRAREVIAVEGATAFHDALAFAVGTPTTQFDRDGANTPDAKLAPRQSKDPIGLHPLRNGALACGIGLAFGHAEASLLEKLTGVAAAAGARGMRTAPNRALLAIGLRPQDAKTFFAAAGQLGFVTRASDPRRHVIACAGAPLCFSGHIAARALAPRIVAAAAPYLGDGSTLHISGCGKGCAHAGTASLTMVGTVDHCALIANGSTRDAPFATGPAGELPAAVARYLCERRAAAASGASHRANRGANHGADHV